MNYRSFDHLNRDIQNWQRELPSDLDLIVGVPRSGLLAGNLLALHLNLPLTTVEELEKRSILQSGRRLKQNEDFSSFKNILVVDDSVNTGKTIESVKTQIESLNLSMNIHYGAAYVSEQGKGYVDTYANVVRTPRVFEWNMMHHSGLSDWAIDLDGVLCRDPLPSENDDGERYREFISKVKPRVVPSKKIGLIVTCRLEKYRDITEEWLSNHGIEYEQLIMMDHPSMEARQAAGNHAEYKANVYDNTETRLFIESDENQAKKIARLTRKPVFCVNSNCMYRQEYLTRVGRETVDSVKTVRSNPQKYARMFADDPVDFCKKVAIRIFKSG
ncbi:orotate phosphoribosyltransferase [Halorubrum salipaludis]|uniref:Orotate phosphoribosyltransferase n=1 Tax=Halorubrum salipaludis TaxID=2032630 RepID=A0A2A2FHG2_9EURY|nr:phosphoribosyltransferase family protein [Halorubrum salipaludis]PAU84941.1 orotate phosphoribosyltransferase [Halorubrum salipaludis]